MLSASIFLMFNVRPMKGVQLLEITDNFFQKSGHSKTCLFGYSESRESQ